MFTILPTVLRVLLGSYLWPSNTQPTGLSSTKPLEFQLRHVHAVADDRHILFKDVDSSFFAQETFTIPSTSISIPRTPSDAFARSRVRSARFGQSEVLTWDNHEVPGPDVEKRETLLTLAKMTSNSYFEGESEKEKDWYDLGSGWNTSKPFGWEPDADGFRGHIFVSSDNSTVVISVKGTSAGWIAGGGGPTVGKDKLNDNLLFSCCCARVGPTWSSVCGCYAGGYKCDQNCVEQALVEDSLFYSVGTNLYNNVTYMYPEADIWVTGHSLGGALASLLGVTFGAPVVAFEAPGERMAAQRLHLPMPPSLQHITHVYHTGDPIPQGQCTGVTSVCALGGYALESGCHLGKVAIYDTVSEWKWSVDVRTHPIKVVIERILSEEWTASEGREVPTYEEQTDCVDCFQWTYGDYKNMTKKHKWF